MPTPLATLAAYSNRHARMRGWLAACLLLLGMVNARAAPHSEALMLPSGVEIIHQRYAADGPLLAVWLTGQYGRDEAEHKAAADMAARGVETWVTDLLAPYFLPLLPSSWSQVPDRDLGDWLQAMRERHSDRRIVLIATGRVAAVALRAVHDWRLRHGRDAGNPVAGALLMYPLLYQELVPGEEPRYDPVVNQTRLDLVILQPMSSAGYWWRERLRGYLESAGSRVWMDVLPGLRDGFYRRGDINPAEIAAGQRLGEIVLDALRPLLNPDHP